MTIAGELTGSAAPRARLQPEVLTQALLSIGVLALVGRLVLVGVSIGSNDMPTWRGFAQDTSLMGLGWMYDNVQLFNHPPLMGLFSSAARWVALHTGVPFDWLFKAPMVLADLLSASLLWRTWRRRSALLGALVFALFCCNPVSIAVSAYHGNTDSLCASLMLVAAVLMDSRKAFWAGLALAASINVKLVPVLLIVPLLACVPSRKAALQYLLGLSLGVLPFLPYMLGHWAGFYEHVLAYRSYPRVWGVTLFSTQLRSVRGLMSLGRWIYTFWVGYGTALVFALPLGLSLVKLAGRRAWGARELVALTMLGFVVITPGWGVQYAVYPMALLFAVDRTGAVWYALAAGAYVVSLYGALWTGTLPIYSEFVNGNDKLARIIGACAWVVAAWVWYGIWRRAPSPPGLERGLEPGMPGGALQNASR